MKAKPILIIVATILIGFVIGMLTSAQLRFHRLQPVRVLFSEGRFREGFYQVIQPDEKQKSTIDALLTKYAKLNVAAQNDFWKKLDTMMKEFRNELEPLLTKDQLNRLKEMEQRRNEMIRSDRRNMPPDSSRFRGRDSGGGDARRPGGGGSPPPRFERRPPGPRPDSTRSD
jgi:hypothetical protein